MEDLAALVLFAQRGVARGELVGDALREGHELDEQEVEAGGGEGGVEGRDCGVCWGGAGHFLFCGLLGLCCVVLLYVCLRSRSLGSVREHAVVYLLGVCWLLEGD